MRIRSRRYKVFLKRCIKVVLRHEEDVRNHVLWADRPCERHNRLNRLVQKYRTSQQYQRQRRIAKMFGYEA
jgi:hypothetical protein